MKHETLSQYKKFYVGAGGAAQCKDPVFHPQCHKIISKQTASDSKTFWDCPNILWILARVSAMSKRSIWNLLWFREVSDHSP